MGPGATHRSRTHRLQSGRRFSKKAASASCMSTPLRSMLGQFLCHASRKAPSLRKVLREKGHRPHGSLEGRLRVNRAVLIGCQVSANEHAPRRLTRRHPYRGRAMRCCMLLSQAHASLCVSPLALEQRNAQGTWRLICHNCRLTKLDKNATVRQTTHIERRRSCVCSKRCSVRLCGARGTGRYRRPTLAPDKDQRRGASDAFVAWLSSCLEITFTNAFPVLD